MEGYSSWGPTDDGRIKPDLVANGYSLYSSYSSGTASYAYSSGTSMAAPNATGTAQLLLSLYTSMKPGEYMRASTLKGLLIHTADDLGTAGPDYKFGWGLVNAKAAADLICTAATNPASRRFSKIKSRRPHQSASTRSTGMACRRSAPRSAGPIRRGPPPRYTTLARRSWSTT